RLRAGLEQLEAATAPAAEVDRDDVERILGEFVAAMVELADAHGVDPEAAVRRWADGFRARVSGELAERAEEA
ncbi:MAG: hypothetical protein WD575_02045, partial [Nitriliruptoraceae bacterium]